MLRTRDLDSGLGRKPQTGLKTRVWSQESNNKGGLNEESGGNEAETGVA